ncbi:MAG: radical SAM protein [bacterium]
MTIDYINRKTLLYRSSITSPDYCLNHVLGCSHGCSFPCYAFLMKRRFGQVKSYNDWLKPKIVANAMELLERELKKYKGKVRTVHLCLSTDPFMYEQDEVIDLSLRIIKRLNDENIRCSVLTKGVYPEVLTDRSIFSSDNDFGITLVSLDDNFKKRYEPYSAPYIERIESLRRLHEKGFRTWVMMEPYPTPNIIKQDIVEILKSVSFARRIIFGRWNYNKVSEDFRFRDEFYESQANVLIEFCKYNKIECEIIEGK